MTATSQHLIMHQGEGKLLSIPVTDAAGAVKDLFGSTIVYKVTSGSWVSTALIFKDNVSTGGIATTSTEGEIEIDIDPADTSSLTPGLYYHECRVVDQYGEPEVVFTGKILIKGSVTA